MDAVTCRNLLIYLNRDAQGRVLNIFHFALRPDGTLFLGSSESVDDDSRLFVTVDKKRRVFARGAGTRLAVPLIPDRGTLVRALTRTRHSVAPSAPPTPAARPPGTAVPPTTEETGGTAPAAWSDLHYEFLERVMPPSVLVNLDHQIVHLSEHAGRFLRVAGGEASMNILQLVDSALRIELRAALYQAAQGHEVIETRLLPVGSEHSPRNLRLRVVPSRATAPTFLLVLFEEQDAVAPLPTRVPDTAAEPLIRRLEQELEQARLQLRNTVEQADASTEELKATNEEFQAMNEELRSATEELETGREELQSVNEELSTVNQELKSKVEELGRSNSGLQNLMASTQIATVFLDNKLCIQRYTPPAVALFRLIPTDVGRPLEDLANQLNYPALKVDAERVLEQLTVAEVEVAHADGRHFLARMLPYRTTENVIAGVVMTFVDISRRRQVEENLRGSESRFRTVGNLVPDLLFSTDAEGQLLWCNERWLAYTGQAFAQAQGFGWVETIHPEDRTRARASYLAAVERGENYTAEHRLLGKDGRARWFLVRAEPLRDDEGRVKQWFGAKTDIDDFKQASAELADSEERLRLIFENAHDFAIISTDLDGRITSWNSGAERIIGHAADEAVGQPCAIIFTPEDRAAGAPEKECSTALAESRASDERWHQRKDGSRFWGSGVMMSMRDARGQAIGFVKILRDQTEARQTREALEQSREELSTALEAAETARAEAEAATRAKDHFLVVLSHELRTPLMPVIMAASMLVRRADLPEQVSDAVTMIQRNVDSETRLIDDLLDVTRISRGKLEIAPAPMDLHQALRRAVEVASPDVEFKGQRLEVVLGAPAYQMRGDFARLQQVFWNLLKNASKFTPESGHIRLESRAGEPGVIVVEVVDSGIGIDARALPRIFGAFTQAGTEITRHYGGLGLGLAIAKAIVEAHGGTLQASSSGLGQGATFTVTLPLTPTGESR